MKHFSKLSLDCMQSERLVSSKYNQQNRKLRARTNKKRIVYIQLYTRRFFHQQSAQLRYIVVREV